MEKLFVPIVSNYKNSCLLFSVILKKSCSYLHWSNFSDSWFRLPRNDPIPLCSKMPDEFLKEAIKLIRFRPPTSLYRKKIRPTGPSALHVLVSRPDSFATPFFLPHFFPTRFSVQFSTAATKFGKKSLPSRKPISLSRDTHALITSHLRDRGNYRETRSDFSFFFFFFFRMPSRS